MKAEWTERKLSEVARIEGGGTPKRTHPEYFGGDIPWITPTDLDATGVISRKIRARESITDVGLKNSSAKLVPASSVLFSSRATIGKIAINDISCATNQGFANFVPNRNVIDTEYLAYVLSGKRSNITELAGKTTFLEVPRGRLKEFKIPVPPLEEQHRIVARIKECMERIEEIEHLRFEANAEREALFESALNKGFTEIRDSYEVKKLEEVVSIRGGASLPKGNPERSRGNVLLVKVAEMNLPGNERVVSTSREYASANLKRKAVIQPGAILFPKRGGAIATNKKRILGEPAYIDPNLMAIEADPGQMDPGFLYYWSRTLDLKSISNGGVIPQLNRKDLAPLQVPVPHLKKQRRFAEEFEVLETTCFQLGTEFTQRDAEASHLRDAILRKAFSGEL